jgi:hypothetical protein
MNEWQTSIRCYLSPAGNNKIKDWYDDLQALEQAYFDEFLKVMRRKRDWGSDPCYRPRLKGCGKLGELRWEVNRKQHRLLGFFADGVWYALVGCTHKQDIYSPANALDTAKKYMGQIQRREVSTVEYDL